MGKQNLPINPWGRFLRKLLQRIKKTGTQSSLQANKVTTRRSTGKSPFELVYDAVALFISQLAKLVLELIQDA